jgi:chromosome partitioning protein
MAGLVVTIAQQKGGAGKTTLAAHLALAWAVRLRVAVIDIDPQGSLAAWFRLRRERLGDGAASLEVQALGGWRVAAEVERQRRDHDIVLIDSAPHAETEARLAVRAASLVLIPVQPSPMDVWATRATLDLAKAERVGALLVLNRVPPRATLTELMAAELGRDAHWQPGGARGGACRREGHPRSGAAQRRGTRDCGTCRGSAAPLRALKAIAA